ncbi:hybrid-cluster NAD(P)-dependent oxidoreductase [Amycolatopsis panacis]|uniref:Hybrid-cluster NAD(P)-dependent oxidoreductase n=1 Tax=Amycolatopsis panacis TaxID=2340917 RepID=A0A419I5N0_9PSEU|nr:hybrid-cluster NAD(P)-dependent oxidoreductase [Amycolatopsis panacis]RJQ86233.1 hybrid-cluster NAD(P)-dependent oxidoreductase [Amycolatopsis panacis]
MTSPTVAPEVTPAEAPDEQLTCTEIVDVTHDVKTFVFELPAAAALSFHPGQFLTFRFLLEGERVERCYTISSPPTRPEQPAITVKRVPGGVVSNWLHDHLQPGDVLGASGPFGRFSFARHPADKYLFLTAGSGITPAMSMLRTLRETGDPADVVFLHSARTPGDIIFLAELAALAEESGVSVVILCGRDSPGEQWRGHRGRLTLPVLVAAAPDLAGREIFTCGPPPYMAAVRELLVQAGAEPGRCHEESFVFGAAAAAIPAQTGTAHRVEFRRSGRVIECDPGTTVLAAAAGAGLALPSSCGEGVCGTCKLTLLDGRVDLRHAGGIRPREIAAGRILACCATPVEDLTIDA